MRVHLAALTAAASLVVAPAIAQPIREAMKDMLGMHSAAAAKTSQGTGIVTAIDQKAGTVTIKHGPIPTVGWPAMTMTFSANPSSLTRSASLHFVAGASPAFGTMAF